MQRIAIDCRFASGSTGLGRYSRELVTALVEETKNVELVLLVKSASEPWLNPLRDRVQILEVRAHHYSLREHWEIPLLLLRQKIDLYFALHFNVPFFCPKPFVVTIHDLILHQYPNQASAKKQYAYFILMKRAITKARHIIAVSDFTAKELEAFYGKRIRKKITVTHEGVGPQFQHQTKKRVEEVRRKYVLQKPFFLYVGNVKEHKNVQMLIDAFVLSHQSDRELLLVTSGRGAEALRVSGQVRFLPPVEDADLPALYSAADAFVTASLYEGFGLPVAEAEACGCPVIASNVASIPEVASKSATLVKPTVKAFAAAMQKKTFPSPTPRKWLWADAAEKTVKVLRKALL